MMIIVMNITIITNAVIHTIRLMMEMTIIILLRVNTVNRNDDNKMKNSMRPAFNIMT